MQLLPRLKSSIPFLTDQEYDKTEAYEEETAEKGGNEKDSKLQYSADLCLVGRHML